MDLKFYKKVTTLQWIMIGLVMYGTYLSHKQYLILKQQHKLLLEEYGEEI